MWTPWYITAFCLGICLIIICIFSHLKNSRKMTLIMKLVFDITATTYLTAVLMATNAIGVYAGIAINAIGAIRSIIFLLKDKYKVFDNICWLFIFEAIQAASLIISYTSYVSIIATVASMVTTLALYLNSQKYTKMLIVLAQSMFIVYYSILAKDSDLLTLLMLVSCCVTFTSAVTGLILLYINRNKKQDTSAQ